MYNKLSFYVINWLELLKLPNKKAYFEFKSLIDSFIKIQFYCSFIESGLAKELNKPKTKQELINALGIKNIDLFLYFLKLGISLRVIKCKNGKYFIKGSLGKVLSSSSTTLWFLVFSLCISLSMNK